MKRAALPDASLDASAIVAGHLEALSVGIGERLVGTPGNRAATDLAAAVLDRLGFEVDCPEFDCLGWDAGGASLDAGSEHLPVLPGPYSLPFAGSAPLVAAKTLTELESIDPEGCILLLHGEIAGEPLAPKNYFFYNPDEHKAIYSLLERRKPAAVIAATGVCPSTAGAVYPFALFDDGDFDIPSACMKDVDGERLLHLAGSTVRLEIVSNRHAATGCNVIGTLRGAGRPRRIVLTAHIDTRPGTPGALDDASGVATLLAAAELQAKAHAGPGRSGPDLEIAILNGEDYFAASGEMAYMAANDGSWDGIALAMNVDGAGYRDGATACSFYGCGKRLERRCMSALAAFPGIIPGEQWVQGDHSLFVMNGVPAAAFTSEQMGMLWSEIAHTDRDRAELADPARLGELARALSSVADLAL